jgi:hypothetical protein
MKPELKNHSMKVPLKIVRLAFWVALVLSAGLVNAQNNDYPGPDQINQSLKNLQKENASVSAVTKLAESPGGNEILMIEIGKEVSSSDKTIPAILVTGNLEGNRPLTSLGALKLAEKVLEEEQNYSGNTWYIIPAANPDALEYFYQSPKFEYKRNDEAYNDDMDEQVDEDNFNDLNGDGYITKMRVKHPEGEWIVVKDEPRLMRKADPKKGETGIYKIYSEGLDDDGDGKYNEDTPGGTNVNRNFPHLFKAFTDEGGLYPGSVPESRAIIEFAFEHPEIAMTFAFGATNFCYSVPKGGRKGEVDLDKIEIPERYANMFGADPDKTYSMKEIIDMVQDVVPAGMTVDESMVASFLGLGAVVNPLNEDLVFYNKFKEDYDKYLEDIGSKGERFDPERAADGSFELWSYYHLGVPVFSMDLWSVPKPEKKKEEGTGLDIEQLENMTSEKFLELGEEKIAAFLKEEGVPEQFTAKRLIAMVEGGQTNPKQMAGMMKQMPKQEKDEVGADPEEKAILDYSDNVLGGKGFVNWEKYNHPQLGEVEIGGFTPFISTTPDFSINDSIFELHLPWIFEIVKELPSLKIYDSKVSEKGAGIYELEIWIENEAYIPFPTAMGKRNKQPSPAVVTLSGDGFSLLSGLERTAIQDVSGKSRKKLSWMIKADKNTEVSVSLTSKSAGNDQETIKIGG